MEIWNLATLLRVTAAFYDDGDLPYELSFYRQLDLKKIHVFAFNGIESAEH
jgi:hypothetical protein